MYSSTVTEGSQVITAVVEHTLILPLQYRSWATRFSAMDPTLPPDPSASKDGQIELDGQSSVGLSDAQLSQSRRQTLDLVNRLHSTGFVNVFPSIVFYC